MRGLLCSTRSCLILQASLCFWGGFDLGYGLDVTLCTGNKCDRAELLSHAQWMPLCANTMAPFCPHGFTVGCSGAPVPCYIVSTCAQDIYFLLCAFKLYILKNVPYQGGVRGFLCSNRYCLLQASLWI